MDFSILNSIAPASHIVALKINLWKISMPPDGMNVNEGICELTCSVYVILESGKAIVYFLPNLRLVNC